MSASSLSSALRRLAYVAASSAALAGCASNSMPNPDDAIPNPGPQGAAGSPQGCHANQLDDGALVGKTEAEVVAMLKGCPWRIGQRDAQQFPGTMDFNPDRRTLGIAGGIVIWVKRG